MRILKNFHNSGPLVFTGSFVSNHPKNLIFVLFMNR